MKHYVINGGGMVGAAAALALSRAGNRVTVVDAQAQPAPGEHWDLRISSVNQNHWQWLLELGVGDTIDWHKVQPYQQLSVTTQTGDELSFSAADADLEQLGVMVENNSLQAALWQCAEADSRIRLTAATRVEQFHLAQQRLQLSGGETLDYDVLIGADGAQSAVARAAAIGYRGWDYGQRCLLANVKLQRPIAATTWEVFRPQGPYALLPLGDTEACLIDYRSNSDIKALSQNADTLQRALQETFAAHIGDFELLRYASFALQRKHALRYHRGETLVLMGDAAHTIHPLAGQGVNLGFADVRCYLACDGDVGRYQRERARDVQRTMRAMDLIHRGFRSQNPLFQLGLKAAFRGLSSTWLKQQVIDFAMQKAE